MGWGETVAWVLVLLLALYGCAALIRRVCLWFVRCPGCAVCCRVAVPYRRAALAPLVRCLQSQMAWDEPSGCRCTLVLMPQEIENNAQTERIFREAPGVIPITPRQLSDLLAWVAQEE